MAPGRRKSWRTPARGARDLPGIICARGWERAGRFMMRVVSFKLASFDSASKHFWSNAIGRRCGCQNFCEIFEECPDTGCWFVEGRGDTRVLTRLSNQTPARLSSSNTYEKNDPEKYDLPLV
jgi:hypothetical protein